MKKSFYLILSILALASCEAKSTITVEYPNSDQYLFGNKVYEGSINKLSVGFIHGNHTISKGSELSVSEKGNHSEMLTVHHLLDGSTLNVQDTGAGELPNYTYIKDVVITIPNALESIEFDVVSSTTTSQIDVKEVSIDSMSGDISLTSNILEKLDISIVSGTIDLYIPKEKTIDIFDRDLVGGEVSGDYIVGDDVEISIEGVSGNLVIHQI